MDRHLDSDRDSVANRIGKLRVREVRARWVGVGVSVGVHLLAILAYSSIAGAPTVIVSPRDADGSNSLQGIELLNLRELIDEPEDADEPTETELLPEPEIVPERAIIPVPVSDRDAAAAETEESVVLPSGPPRPQGLSAAERLRIRSNDERLWDFSQDAYIPTVERMLTAELAGRINTWADSLAIALERDAAATDWTWTDDEGNRWGVSPGKLHLGSITLPLPFNFGIAPGRFEEYMERQYIDRELSRNVLTGLILETWKDRAEAMKARRDRERADRLQNAGPRRIVPDTTRRGGG